MTDDNIIVLDHSINSRLLWPDTASPDKNQYALTIILQAEQDLFFHVPTIWHCEVAQVAQVAQVAYSLTKSAEITQADAQNYFNLLCLLPIRTDLRSPGSAKCSYTIFSVSVSLVVSVRSRVPHYC